MKSLFSYMLTIFAIFFWITRLLITLAASFEQDIGIQPINMNQEIILLFCTVIFLVLIIKRIFLGGLIYLLAYSAYFGTDAYNKINLIMNQVAVTNVSSLFLSIIGIIIALLTFFDLALNKNRGTFGGGDKKTGWFYQNKDFDRKIDERADKNQYRM